MSIGAPKYRDSNVETLSAAKVLVANDPYEHALDPGGAGRNIDLPVAVQGMECLIVNTADAAEDLTVRLTAAGATVAVISQDQIGYFYADSTTWRGGMMPET